MVGSRIMVEINDILGLRFLRPTTAAASPRELLAGLQPGQTALVKVLARAAQDNVLLQIGAETIQVKDRSGLAPGREVMVAVVQDPDSEDELVLRILDRPIRTGGSIPARLRSTLPQIKPIGPLIKELINELEKLPTPPDSRTGRANEQALAALRASRFRPGVDSAEQLRISLDRLGLDLEAALNKEVGKKNRRLTPRAAVRFRSTVKARLVELINQLRSANADRAGQKPLPAELEKAVNRLIFRLEQMASGSAADSKAAPRTEAVPLERTDPLPPSPRLSGVGWSAGQAASGGSGDRTVAEPAIKDQAGLIEAAAAFRRRVLGALTRLVNSESAPADWTAERRGTVIRRLDQATTRLVDQLIRTIVNSNRQANQPVTRELIAGLRQSLAKMLSEFGLSGHRAMESSLNRLEAGLQNLEFLQLANVTAQETDSALIIPLTWGPDMGLNQGEINLFHPPDHDRDKKDGPLRLLFALDMTKLGPVRIDVSLDRKQLMINFFLAHEPMVLAGRARRADLTERLNKLGYQVKNVSFRVIKKAPPREAIAPKPVLKRGMVDLKA